MSSNPEYDRWYAARMVRILIQPSHELETFGNTLVNYHLVSELDDYPGKIRIREGRLEAHQDCSQICYRCAQAVCADRIERNLSSVAEFSKKFFSDSHFAPSSIF